MSQQNRPPFLAGKGGDFVFRQERLFRVALYQQKQVVDAGGEFGGDALKGLGALLWIFDRGGVGKTPVNFCRMSWKDRTRLAGIVANGNDIIKGLTEKFGHGFGALFANVDAEVSHRLNGIGMHAGRFGARAERFDASFAEGVR